MVKGLNIFQDVQFYLIPKVPEHYRPRFFYVLVLKCKQVDHRLNIGKWSSFLTEVKKFV